MSPNGRTLQSRWKVAETDAIATNASVPRRSALELVFATLECERLDGKHFRTQAEAWMAGFD